MGDKAKGECGQYGIDTAGISDSIRVRLMKAGKFRFVAGDAGQTEIGDQVSFQQGSGRVDGDMAKAFGLCVGGPMFVVILHCLLYYSRRLLLWVSSQRA